jgi:hypothetical protein
MIPKLHKIGPAYNTFGMVHPDVLAHPDSIKRGTRGLSKGWQQSRKLAERAAGRRSGRDLGQRSSGVRGGRRPIGPRISSSTGRQQAHQATCRPGRRAEGKAQGALQRRRQQQLEPRQAVNQQVAGAGQARDARAGSRPEGGAKDDRLVQRRTSQRRPVTCTAQA